MPPRANKPSNKARPATPPRKGRGWLLIAGIAGVVIVAGVFLWPRFAPRNADHSNAATPSFPAAPVVEDEQKVFAQYAGSESCRSCHQEAYDKWAKSNHGLAERSPDAGMDRAAFDPARSFKHGTQQTSVRVQGTNYLVTCPGLSATNETHEVARVIGNDPLRQFLVAFPGGRFQTLEASYDPHRNEWFDVYGNEDRMPGEWGHWTGRGMNWNSMCAGCHNTRLRKNYDPPTDSYHTAMAAMTVGCESCHGPLKSHVEWQRDYGKSGKKDPTLPKFTRNQVMENCGFCHARRTDLTGDFKPGDSFFDHQSLVVVDRSPIYYPDGQVHEEDYEFAAFLGSRMHTNGVTCMDCHDPHTMKTILPGNALCMRCHNGSYTNAPVIDPVAHSHHKVFGYAADGKPMNIDLLTYKSKDVKESGGECINCHMPQTVYMQRHWRHDHGFTIPDPLLTKEYGVPNACNRCHTDKSTDWALQNCDKWFGAKMDRATRKRAESVVLARRGDVAARQPLLEILAGKESPYWRAVAAGLLGQWVAEPAVSTALLKALHDPHPLVREQAVRALEPLMGQPTSTVTAALRDMLDDPSRNVRVAAAWAVRANLPPGSRASEDLRHFLNISSDEPAGQLQDGAFAIANGKVEDALAHYEKAVAWDANSAPTRHDLAVVLSMLGRNNEAIDQLLAACRLDPNDGEYQFKLGLAYSETGALDKTAAALEKAVQLDPRHARAWYNLGLARNSLGQMDGAIDALVRAESFAPNDPQIPYARATILLRTGRVQEAKAAASRAVEINPQYPEATQLLKELSRVPSAQ
jgi:tetratricopeptide (TPR) repeat protein